MENKQLEEELRKQILKAENLDDEADIVPSVAAKACSSITLSHMKEVIEFVNENSEQTPSGLRISHLVDHNSITTEQLIDLYFESLNKKS